MNRWFNVPARSRTTDSKSARGTTCLAVVCIAALVAVFVAVVLLFREKLRTDIHQTIIDRDAAVLRPVVLDQLARQEPGRHSSVNLLSAVLESAQQENVLAIAVFDPQAELLDFVPKSLLFAELPLDDYIRLLKRDTISRYHPKFPLDRYFSGVASGSTAPVLEVILALQGRDRTELLGYAQYYVDARALTTELALTDERIDRQTVVTLAVGATLIVIVFLVAYFRLRRASRQIARRNEELIRTSYELTLAAKASALGQITSHLVHGLQGPVAGLRTMITEVNRGTMDSAWNAVSAHTDQMQEIIQESVTLLGDMSSRTSYEFEGTELAALVKRRNSAAAEKKGVRLLVTGAFDAPVDNHRGHILCLITSNLVQNAIEATTAGRTVQVNFSNEESKPVIVVSDEGSGIPEDRRSRLFEPGHSTRVHGSGLGLAISQLLARQINAAIALASTGSTGTVFRITVGT